MMRRNSYTSSSNHLRYLLLTLPFLILWILLAFALVAFNHSREINIPQDALYLYQLNKIIKLKEADTVFIGDSSLGNAIDSKVWDKVSGEKSINLALTQRYFGYLGGYMLLSNVLLNGVKPKNVVIFFSPEQMWVPVSYDAFMQQTHFFWSEKIPFYKIIFIYWQGYMNKQALWFNLKKFLFPEGKVITSQKIANDYMEQTNLTRAAGRDFGNINYTQEMIKPENTPALEKIYNLCKVNGLNCIYAHGILVDQLCSKMRKILPAANSRISDIGFPIVKNTPVCPPSIDMGDTPMHVHPELKDKYTKEYYRLIKPYLFAS